MHPMISLFQVLLLALLLLAGQWSYADHELVATDAEHHHSSECQYCASPGVPLVAHNVAPPVLPAFVSPRICPSSQPVIELLFRSNCAIRAPPVTA